jgi:hypothetical protein
MPIILDKIHPTTYEIVVSGRVSPERAEWFGEMTLTVLSTDSGQHVTALTGPVADQAALFGILSRIRDLGLKLISVTAIEPTLPTSAHTNSN